MCSVGDFMSDPKLMIINGAWRTPVQGGVDIGALIEILGKHFTMLAVEPGDAMSTLRREAIEGVLAPAGDFLPMQREIVQLQSNALLNALGEGVCLADGEGAVLWSNSEFSAYSATTRAKVGAVCRQAARSLAEGHSQGDSRRRFDIAVEGNAGGNEGTTAGGAGGVSGGGGVGGQWLEVMISPVAMQGPVAGVVAGGVGAGGASRVIAVVRDVTTQRRRQHKMDLIDRAGSELVRIDAEEVRKLRTTERLRVLEQKIVKFAHDLLHFDHFAIRLLDERSGKLELVMSQGLPPEAMEVELYARSEGNGISGFVAATGKSYICVDAAKDQRYVVGIKQAGSSLTVPLRLSDKVIGVFNVESTHIGAFGEEDRQFAEMFSTHVALAVHILDLLVVERCAVGMAVTGNVEGELSEPLEDIKSIAAKLKDVLEKNAGDASMAKQLERILVDVEAIKRRVKDVAAGPGTILGAEKALADAALDPTVAGRRVLVADDDARIRQTVRQLLVSLGAEVVVCEDGAAAIAALSGVSLTGAPGGSSGMPGQERMVGAAGGNAGSGRAFDLLISDIKMPDKTGYEIFAAAKKVLPNLPVILMTGFGYDPHHSIVRASEEGLQCVLFKPFQAERLIEEVHKAMSGGK